MTQSSGFSLQNAGCYYPSKNAYFINIYYNDEEFGEAYFYDEPEDKNKPMELKIYNKEDAIFWKISFQELEELFREIKREFELTRKDKKIKKGVF